MKAIVFVILTLSTFASAQYVDSSTMRDQCITYIAQKDNGKTTWDGIQQATEAMNCLGFANGFMDEAIGEIVPDVAGSDNFVVGYWGTIKPDQLIRVFVKYVNANPELLNQPAVIVMRKCAVQAGLYTFTPLKRKASATAN